jgi:hypothetical protein
VNAYLVARRWTSSSCARSCERRAASLGTAVHDAAALGKTPEQVPDEVAPRLRRFLASKAASQAESVAAEFQVFSTTYGNADIRDALVRFPGATAPC